MIATMDTKIITLLQSGTLMLTVNLRLANYYQQEFRETQRQQGNKSWTTPSILPFANWLEHAWQSAIELNLLPPAYLLNPQQELALWREIISSSSNGADLLNIYGTAKSAQQAWQIMNQWYLPWHEALFLQNQDTSTFFQWAQQFNQHCQTNNYISNTKIIEQLYDLYQKSLLIIPKIIILVGFDEIPPHYQKLLILFRESGCNIIDLYEKKIHPRVSKIVLNDTEDELTTMALWAKNLQKKYPDAKIGCVVHNLNDVREHVRKTFCRIINAETILDNESLYDPFNISAGCEFASYALIDTAFAILQLPINNHLAINKIIRLLRSPFLAGSDIECSTRALFIRRLLQLGILVINLDHLLLMTERYCSVLFRHLKAFMLLQTNAPERAKPSEWAIFFAQQLSALGWPGERQLDSTEYQLLQRWHTLLEEFASLDWLLGKISQISARENLYHMARALDFQTQSPRTSLQILGLLEASGQQFDYLWLMGMHDGVFPANPQPNPFIPIGLQREFNTPHASAERELHFAKLLLARLKDSANTLIISYPRQEEDRDLRPTPVQ